MPMFGITALTLQVPHAAAASKNKSSKSLCDQMANCDALVLLKNRRLRKDSTLAMSVPLVSSILSASSASSTPVLVIKSECKHACTRTENQGLRKPSNENRLTTNGQPVNLDKTCFPSININLEDFTYFSPQLVQGRYPLTVDRVSGWPRCP